jgi:hypothetical protein
MALGFLALALAALAFSFFYSLRAHVDTSGTGN